jgi:hypothetical protein
MFWQPGSPETMWEKHFSDPCLEQNVMEDFLAYFLFFSFCQHGQTEMRMDREADTEMKERIRFSADIVNFVFLSILRQKLG